MKLLSEKDLKDLLKNPKNAPNKHFVSDCLWCGKVGHLYVHKGINKKGVQNGFDCKRCSISGNIFTLLAKLDKLFLITDGKQVEHAKLNRLDTEINEEDLIIDLHSPDRKLPIGSKKIDIESNYYNYLLKRKFTEIDFEYYEPQYTNIISKLKDYIIIPIKQDFSVKGYVSRYSLTKDDENYDESKLRYINAKNVNFGKLVCGIDEVNQNTKTAILVEGFFDKVSVTTELNLHYNDDLKCLCTFGKKISLEQVELIRKTNIKNLILMYDERDAVNDMKKIGFFLQKYFNVLIASTGDNDPGDCEQEDFYNILGNLKTPNEFWLDKIQKKKFN